MTVKEFSKKYGLSYSTVYSATYLVKKRPEFMCYERQYEEQELKTALKTMLTNRMDRHKREYQKAAGMLKKIGL